MSNLKDRNTRSTRGYAVRRTATRQALTVVAAAAAALALWTLADPVTGVELAVQLDETVQPVGPGAVAAASLLAGLGAWGLFTLLERTMKRPRRTWTVIAVVVLAVSLTGPLGGAVDTASMVTLTSMHLIVAAVLIAGLARRASAS